MQSNGRESIEGMDTTGSTTTRELQVAARVGRPPALPYLIELAETSGDVQAAQRLRYKVFAEEMGASLTSGIDRDPFDPYCDHLLVRERHTAQVVGTYRILTAERAREAGGFYSANEFDLSRLSGLGRIVEVGRACVHPDHRDGVVISLLWAGLLDYIWSRGFDHVIGCASVRVTDSGRSAMSVCNRLKRNHMSSADRRVFPYRPFLLDEGVEDEDDQVPPLIKGYLRLGASVCGDPAWDQDFRTADLLLMLSVADLNPRYASGLRRRAARGRA